MKTILKTLLIFLFIGIPFSSCDSVESLADIKFNASLGADLNVVIPGETSTFKGVQAKVIGFSEEETIDPQSDSNIKKYLDKLKSFDVQEVTATVTKISKPVTITSGTISIVQGSKSASWSVSNFEVVNGAKIILDSGEGQWATINQILKNKGKFTAKIMGVVDGNDVTFTFYILIKVKVVANPLN